MEYTAVLGDDGGEFKKLINKMIKDSWEPLGGISVASNGSGVLFAQAMIRKQERNKGI